MREKINELREQEQEISEEIKMNEELGKKVLGMVETKATQSEFSKYELFIGELNKIVALLLSTFVLLTFLGSLYTLLLVQYDSFLRRTTFFYKYIHPHTAKPNSLVPWQAKPKPPGSQSDPRMS